MGLFDIIRVWATSMTVTVKLTRDGPSDAMPLLERAQENVRLMGSANPLTQAAIVDLETYLIVAELGAPGALQRVQLWASRLPKSVQLIVEGAPVDLHGRRRMWTWEALAVVFYELQENLVALLNALDLRDSLVTDPLASLDLTEE
jgi:hypothetical protein